jgi:glucose-6-phosphate dehydrogenase assembly protein OpcA
VALTISVADLQAYIGTDESGEFITSCLNAGHALVDRYQGEAEVPQQVHVQAVLICASEIFHRRSTPQGIAQFATNEGSPVRVARDPMGAVYPLLLPYVGYGV